ncbi:CidA/LrgA family protein [Brevibacillus gelatini]|uniref:CidA/LrgA family protein n=1 Tax=Brevibacillus gelatini TaxID=1655277 RepID=A0A3M8B2F8_9BACL|nr:CidA/LrgA family protein [Brevibacillus gelatini]RNB57624.1 CidA/LrgA family protein [Brevibacillus gelatini]
MKMVTGIGILLAFYGVGVLASEWLHIPLPGNLVGMLLLTIGLVTGWIRMEWVEKASMFLIRHMMLFFVPIIVGVATYLNLFAQAPWPIALSLIVGPLLVMLVTGRVVQSYLHRQQQKTEAAAVEERRTLDA